MTIDVIVKANKPKARTTMLEFRSQGCEPVKVFVNQAAGTAASDGSDEEVELVSPDPSSGISVDPESPDADQPCTIIFKPESDNPLYGHTGELYGHFGVVVDGDWQFVPTDWGTTEEKTHFTKVADNHWEFRMEPSIREYFGSGETPVTKIALIVRTADGNTKSHEADQFCSVQDNKYKAEEFVPDPLVTKKLPEGVNYGINYNADGSVTFVVYDKDTAGLQISYGVKHLHEENIHLQGFTADSAIKNDYRPIYTAAHMLNAKDIRHVTVLYPDGGNELHIKGVEASQDINDTTLTLVLSDGTRVEFDEKDYFSN